MPLNDLPSFAYMSSSAPFSHVILGMKQRDQKYLRGQRALLTDCNTLLCMLIYAWGLDESSARARLFVLRSQFLRVAHLNAFCMFMMCPYVLCGVSFASLGFNACARQTGEVAAGCITSVCSCVIRPDLRLTRAHQEQCLVPHFLCSQWRWDLLTIFTQGIMMFDLTLFWVCLCEGYFHPLLPLREKTDRSYVHRRKKKKSLRSLFMDDARSVYFCARPSEWRAAVLHCR